MTKDNLARTSLQPRTLDLNARRTAPRYENELANQQNRLRAALAREHALRRRNHELVQQQEILSKLFAHREDAADRVKRLTPRQRQIMELVLRATRVRTSPRTSASVSAPSRTIAPFGNGGSTTDTRPSLSAGVGPPWTLSGADPRPS